MHTSTVTGLEEKVSALEIALVEKISEIDALMVRCSEWRELTLVTHHKASRPHLQPGEVDVGQLQGRVKGLEQELQAKTTRVDVAVCSISVLVRQLISFHSRLPHGKWPRKRL